MATVPQDRTLGDLLARHLDLIKEPIHHGLSSELAEVEVLNRCANLLVDLVQWNQDKEARTQVYNQVYSLYHQRRLPALELKLQLVLLLRAAIH